MAQRLIKTPGDAGQGLEAGGRPLSAAHEQIVSILRSRLGQNHADLLAAPKAEADGGIGWSTGLAGTVTPAAQLAEPERDKLQQRAERILSEIRGLAQQLAAEGPAAQLVAQMLARSVSTPPGDWLYSVGGKPVMVMWGHGAAGSAASPPPAAAAPMAAPPPVTATGPLAAAAGGGGAAAPWKRGAAGALIGVLLLAMLLWGLKRCAPLPAADKGLAERIAQAEAGNRSLEEELARKRGQKPQVQCRPDDPPPAARAPDPAPSVPEPRPIDGLRERIAAAGRNCDQLQTLLKDRALLDGKDAETSALKAQILRTLEQHCRERLIREAKNMCPGDRPKELAPEVALVFDASGSMGFSLEVSDQEMRRSLASIGGEAVGEALLRQFGTADPRAAVYARLRREPRRITVARRAALAVSQRAPSDTNIGLVAIEDCPAARRVGFYGPGQRGALAAQIQGIEPRRRTPLADGIARGGQMVDGVRREALMVVISDGVDTCGGDPCAAAAALKRQKPHLKINVVDINGTGAGNCVANLTGGKVFTARSAEDVVQMTNRAAQDAMGPASCRR